MRTNYIKKPELAAPTEDVVKAQLALLQGGLLDPLIVICLNVMKDVADGHNVFLTFGATRNNDAFLVTLSEEGRKFYAAGEDLASLADALRSLASGV